MLSLTVRGSCVGNVLAGFRCSDIEFVSRYSDLRDRT